MWQRLRLAATAAAVGLAACATGPGTVVRDGDRVFGVGTVQYTQIEGGFYVIKGEDDNFYVPMVLPEAFQQDDLRVHFSARLRPDVLNLLMMGELVEILSIERY